MPVKKVYSCEPCNYEYEHIDFGVPASMQKPIPPCPLCSKPLTYDEPESTDDYNYQCWVSEGGCGLLFSVIHITRTAPNEYPCPKCGKMAKYKTGFSILHGKSSSKGASIDVVIGRDADTRWTKIHDRKSIRDKIRQDSGTPAITATSWNDFAPLKGAKLTPVSVPKDSENK